MKKYNVGIIGATGMVGQRFSLLLDKHPWFNVVCVAASPRSAGKKLKDAVAGKWKLSEPLPEAIGELTVLNAEEDVEKIASMVDFVFCAVDMKKDEIRALEEKYAKAECPVVSNNSAHRHTPDVPMVIPEVNPEHIEIIASRLLPAHIRQFQAQERHLKVSLRYLTTLSHISAARKKSLRKSLLRSGVISRATLSLTQQLQLSQHSA